MQLLQYQNSPNYATKKLQEPQIATRKFLKQV